jgi:hypothetical protein
MDVDPGTWAGIRRARAQSSAAEAATPKQRQRKDETPAAKAAGKGKGKQASASAAASQKGGDEDPIVSTQPGAKEAKDKKGSRKKNKEYHEEEHSAEVEDVPKSMHMIFEMLEVLTKSSLQTSQVLRALQGSVWITFLVPISLVCCVEAKRAGREYHELDNKKDYPEPHVVIFMAFLEAVAGKDEETGDSPGAEDRSMLRRWVHHFGQHLPQLMGTLVMYFRGVEAYKAEDEEQLYKVSFVLDPLSSYPSLIPGQMIDVASLQIPLLRELTRLGGVRKTGPPPRGALERVLQKLLLRLQKARAK